ncbi:MAG: hypothetical protein ACI4VQ_00690, partial [Clostridia bacterium]
PREYIRGAFFTQGDTILYSNNEQFRGDKKVEKGIYNNQTINYILENLKSSEKIQSVQIERILEIIRSDFSIDNDMQKLKGRMSIINKLLTKVEDREDIGRLNTIIEEIYESIRNPLEKEFEKIARLDFSQLSADEVAKHIQDFVLNGSNTLRELMEQKKYFDFDRMLEMYRRGLEILSEDALKELSQDYRANNANAMVRGKTADINRVAALLKQVEPLDELEIFGKLKESDREEYNALVKKIDEAKARVCENSIFDLGENAFLGGKTGKSTINTPTIQKEQIRKGQENAEERKIEIPEEKIQLLNEFIQKNLDNRRNSTDYELLHKISEMIARDLKVTNRNFGEITKPSTEEHTQKVALEFFKSLDKDLYERAKNIIEGNSDIEFNMYKLDKDDDFSMQKDNGMPVHTKKPCVFSKKGKSAVYVPCKGTIEDIYLLVHELSHTFDLIPNDNPTRNLLGEVTPDCFEAMLSQYLVERGIATRGDVINREKGDIVSHYDDGVETFAKLELMKVKDQKGEIKQEDIRAIQRKYGLTNRQLEYVLVRLEQSEPNVDYRARYMIAQIVSPHYMEQYKENPKTAIKTLKEYFEMIKDNNLAGALEKLGIQPTLDSVPRLIETSNRRINRLEQPALFSEQEIGKGTINVPTEEKDKANSQFYAKEIEKKLQD